MMRPIKLIVVHCSASDVAAHDNIQTIRQWHKENGWDDVGYHFVITKNGEISVGRPESVVGAHVKGHNTGSIGICLTGDKVFSKAQFDRLGKLLDDLMVRYNLDKSDVVAHHDLQPGKTCPNFDVHAFVAKRPFVK